MVVNIFSKPHSRAKSCHIIVPLGNQRYHNCYLKLFVSLLLPLCNNSYSTYKQHSHTHIHTHREREREKRKAYNWVGKIVQKTSKFYAHYLNLLASNVNLHFYFELCGKDEKSLEQAKASCSVTCVEKQGGWAGDCSIVVTAVAATVAAAAAIFYFVQRRSKQVHENKTKQKTNL